VLRDSRKLFDTAARLFLKCKKSGLSGRPELIVAGAGVQNWYEPWDRAVSPFLRAD